MLIAKASGAGAPLNATFITQTPNASLTNEQALSALGSGILYSTTGTGVVSIEPFITSISTLGTAADQMIYTTGVDTAAETPLTAFARTILDDANAAAVRNTLGLGTIALINDAASDGFAYGRLNAAWAKVAGLALANTFTDEQDIQFNFSTASSTKYGLKSEIRLTNSSTRTATTNALYGAVLADTASANITGELSSVLAVAGSRSGAGTININRPRCFDGYIQNFSSNATIITSSIFYGRSPVGSGTVNEIFGLYLENLQNAVYTNAGLNRFGDQVSVIGSADRTQLIVKSNGTQTTPLVDIQDSSGNTYSKFNKAGYFMTKKTSAPADGDLANSEMALWLDPTPGTVLLMIKAKNSAGTVVTGSVALV